MDGGFQFPIDDFSQELGHVLNRRTREETAREGPDNFDLLLIGNVRMESLKDAADPK